MRLINTNTLLLESKRDLSDLKYAILSHTWGPDDDEVTFKEWTFVHNSAAIKGTCHHVHMSESDIKAKPGYIKIIEACEQAKRDGLDYLWCDTNCIKKESDAELSEAINSMFAWYRQSHICYAYLADVRVPEDANSYARSGWSQDWIARHHLGWFAQPDRASDTGDARKLFQDSRWWSRGWTLQELLAPERVMFFDAGWTPLGHKTELADWIAEFTTIHRQALESPTTIPGFSIAQRMSWAAERSTSVPEDMAYCLLGIFDINMPMIYGPGSTAFMKLQEEIIQVSPDMSILAWQDVPNSPPTGVLAPSPSFFRHCGDIVPVARPVHSPYSVTHFGLSMRIPLLKVESRGSALAELNCCRKLYSQSNHRDLSETDSSTEFSVRIPLKHMGADKWLRTHSPLSQVYLEDTYEDLADSHTEDVFLLVSHPATANTSHPSSIPEADRTSGGLFLTFGAGTMDSDGYLTEARDLPEFSSVVLGDGKLHGLSHLLVSYGAFTSIFSIARTSGAITAFRFVTTNASKSELLESRADNDRTWRDILGGSRGISSQDTMEEASALDLVQRSISTQFGRVTEENFPMSPSVKVLAGPRQNLWGKAEVLVSYIFK